MNELPEKLTKEDISENVELYEYSKKVSEYLNKSSDEELEMARRFAEDINFEILKDLKVRCDIHDVEKLANTVGYKGGVEWEEPVCTYPFIPLLPSKIAHELTGVEKNQPKCKWTKEMEDDLKKLCDEENKKQSPREWFNEKMRI